MVESPWTPVLDPAPLNPPEPEALTFDAWYVEFNRRLRILVAAAKQEGAAPRDTARSGITGQAWADIRSHALRRIG